MSNFIVKGVTITDQLLRDALSRIPGSEFSRSEFAVALKSAGLNHPDFANAVRCILQHLKRRKIISYDDTKGHWMIKTNTGNLGLTAKTQPLMPFGQITALPILSNPDQTKAGPLGIFAGQSSRIQAIIIHLTCFAAVLALVIINASFAWELAETEMFRFAFVAGLMASDLMRPLLIAKGLQYFDHRHIGRASLAMIAALALAPVSVLSSTSVISAALFLGAEENTQNQRRNETREALQDELDRLKVKSVEQRREWKHECARGGCGKIAAKIDKAVKSIDEESKAILLKIVALTEASNDSSGFIARTVKAFEALHLFSEGRTMLIPLLMALTLEISALFGPALLLGHSGTKQNLQGSTTKPLIQP